jgi:hypothetical protein
MARPKSAAEMAMFPGLVEVIVRIVAACIVADPRSAVVNVRCVGMTGLVAEITIVFLPGSIRLAATVYLPVEGSGAMLRRPQVRSLPLFVVLRE